MTLLCADALGALLDFSIESLMHVANYAGLHFVRMKVAVGFQ